MNALFLLASLLAPGPYHVVKRISLPGEGGWDLLTVDAAARRLYVTHGTRVQVVDIDRDSLVGEIPNTPGVHGTVVAPDLARGYTSNGRAGAVTIFDLRTLATLGTVDVKGENPDAIIYDPASLRVFTFNGRSHNATAIDAATGTVAGMIALDGKPEFAVADGAGEIYLNVEDKAELAELDSRGLKVLHTWPIAGCEEPSGLALDRAHARLFVGCGNAVMVVVDARDGHVVASEPIGKGVDAVAFDSSTGLAFSSNGEGSVTVVREETPDRYSVAETVPTQRSARTCAIDQRTHRLFLAAADLTPAPPPSDSNPRPRPGIVPGSFVILVLDR